MSDKIKWLMSKKIIWIPILLVILFFYFRYFFTNGVYFEDTFLKKEVAATDTYYSGENRYGKLNITVREGTGSNAEVIYDLPSNIHEQYMVYFKEIGTGIEIVNEEGTLVFEGTYDEDTPFLFKNGKPYLDDGIIRIHIDGKSPFTDNYQIGMRNVVSFATGSNETIRGDYSFLILAFILFGITLFDYKFPLFFFYLRNFLDVKDPEPSDFYLTMQRISWYVIPIIGIILMIVAIC